MLSGSVWGYVVGGGEPMTAQQLYIYIAVTILLLIIWRIVVHRYGCLDESIVGLLILGWFVSPIFLLAMLLTSFIMWLDEIIKGVVSR